MPMKDPKTASNLYIDPGSILNHDSRVVVSGAERYTDKLSCLGSCSNTLLILRYQNTLWWRKRLRRGNNLSGRGSIPRVRPKDMSG